MSTTEAPPAPSWDIRWNDRESLSGGTWLTVEYKNVPVDGLGHEFTSKRGDGTVHGAMVLNSKYDISQFMPHNTFSCQLCDAFASFDLFDDDERGARLVYVNRIKDNGGAVRCPVSDAGLEWTVDLAVPSGRMIVSDDLRPVYNVELRYERDVPGYSSTLGQELHCKEYEEIGCAYGPTSNIALGLYRLPDTDGPDRYSIASVDDETEPGEGDHYDAVEVADISTDLWAYSVADFEHYAERARSLVASEGYEEGRRWDNWSLSAWLDAGARPDQLPDDTTVVDVTPGTYRFTHHGGRPDFDEQPWPLVWASIERLGD